MTAITFDGTTVPSREIIREFMAGTGGANAYELTVRCRTPNYSDYTTLVAKASTTGGVTRTLLLSAKTSVQSEGGTKGSLVVNGTTYTNCYIESITNAEVTDSNLKVWEFTISFVRETV